MSKHERERILAELAAMSDTPLPVQLSDFDEATLAVVEQLVSGIVERERAGMDGLFSSITHTMKFIPNVLLQTLTGKYIEPPIAARIASYLTLNQATGIANGLKPEYLAHSCAYMDAYKAAELLGSMQPRKAKAALELAVRMFPEKALDLMECLEESVLAKLITKDVLSKLDANLAPRTKVLLESIA